MAHHTLRSGYHKLVERLNRFPQGAPPSETLYQILKVLFSEEEARLMALLPIKPFTVKTASEAWKTDPIKTQNMLDQLSSKAVLLDIGFEEGTLYVMPPPMAGFFEFAMMRLRGDIDQKMLAQLFYQYLNVEEDFVKALFANGETQLGRAFVNEPSLSEDNALHVLDYERATHVIQTAEHIGVGICYCRHKMQHMDRACDASMDICMTFNNTALSLTRHGYARAIDRSECTELLHKAYGENLVQFGENVRERVNFICNCCGCCCEAMIAARKYANLQPVHTTNFIPRVSEDLCNGCQKCVKVCPVEAMTAVSSHDPHKPNRKKAKVDEAVCLGCGVCVRVCPTNGIRLESRPKRVITPVNGAHKAVLMAIERGKLQNLIFDNQLLASHRAMAAILGAILKLPPLKQIMASRQMKSRYLEALILKAPV